MCICELDTRSFTWGCKKMVSNSTATTEKWPETSKETDKIVMSLKLPRGKSLTNLTKAASGS